MNQKIVKQETTLCPSSQSEMKDSAVFGIVTGTPNQPEVTYLSESQPVTEELMDLSDSVTPTEVFRIASTCAAKGCQHFDGNNCRLVSRIVENLSEVTEELPPCSIRSNCRWWKQEGKAACMRCPQVVTTNYNSSELISQVAKPNY